MELCALLFFIDFQRKQLNYQILYACLMKANLDPLSSTPKNTIPSPEKTKRSGKVPKDSILMNKHMKRNKKSTKFEKYEKVSEMTKNNSALSSINESITEYQIDYIADGDRYKNEKHYKLAIDQYFFAQQKNPTKEGECI